jgi:hypothetical protein
MTKAMLLYADDFNETPPFVATGHNYAGANGIPDPNETWLMNCMTQPDPKAAIDLIANHREEEWPQATKPPRSGTLFAYTRFETLYRCPEFEKTSDPGKTHNVFNYTRAIWGRFYKLPIETGWTEQWGDVQGHIMKPSQVFNPSMLSMMLDEQWNRFVACQPDFGDTDGACYNCNDYLFAEHNNIGSYHGTPVSSGYTKSSDPTAYILDYGSPGAKFNPFLWKRGGVGWYDGHAELYRDPWPTFKLGNNTRLKPWRGGSGAGARQMDELDALMGFVLRLIYAQRGKAEQQATIHWD